MAIVNSARWTMAGLGTASLRGQALTVNWTAGTTVTATIGPLTNKLNLGVLRLKISGITGTPSISSFVITGTDGTTTVYLNAMTITAGVALQGGDFLDEFQSDLNLQTFVATVTFSAAPTAAVVDFEVWGQENSGGP